MNNNEFFEEQGLNPLRYMNLVHYINEHKSFKLKHIIEWCCNQSNNQVAETLLLYIGDNNLTDMESEYIVNHVSFRDFAEREMTQEYERYLGYDMYKVQ